MLKYTEYLEPYLGEIRDIQAIGSAVDPFSENVMAHMEQSYYNQFVSLSDEETLHRYEKLFELIPKPEESLDFRKNRLLAKFALKQPITMNMLLKYLEILDPEAYVELDAAKYILSVYFKNLMQNALEEQKVFLRRIIPANLMLYFGVYTPLDVTLPVNSGIGPSYTQTVLPWILPGEFEDTVHPASGMANIQTTALPELPDVPRKAYVMGEDGVVSELYVRDDETGEIHPVYINPIATWEGENDA
jgi:hypothetical protein